MANVQNISIDGTSYSCRDNTKALKSEAIKNITRSGTTFTATRCNGTTFTFTQQDNNTWRPVQNNLTSQSASDCLSAKQGFILATTDLSPNYASVGLSSGNISPTSTGYTWTSTNHNSVAFISYWRQTPGYTLTIQVNGNTVFQVPANTAGFGTATVPLMKGQVLKLLTDSNSATWTCNIRAFNSNLY